jgi:hypothetical protein
LGSGLFSINTVYSILLKIMQPFHLIVLSIAVILLILILAYMGSVLYYAKSVSAFPPTSNLCPDNWAYNPTSLKCELPTHGNIGKPIIAAADPVYVLNDSGVLGIDPNSDIWSSSGKSSICGKQQWALLKNVQWDGVSNYNQC